MFGKATLDLTSMKERYFTDIVIVSKVNVSDRLRFSYKTKFKDREGYAFKHQWKSRRTGLAGGRSEGKAGGRLLER